MLIDESECKLKLIVSVIFYLLYVISALMNNTSLLEESAVVTGVVNGASGFPHPQTVFAIDYSTDRVYNAHVNQSGYFILDSLPSGTYTFVAQSPYFTADTISNVAIVTADSLSLTFLLSCNDNVPYPQHTYTYVDTIVESSLILNRFIASESENIDYTDRWRITLIQLPAQTQSDRVRHVVYGKLISDIFSFRDYPLETYMSWATHTSSSDLNATIDDVSVEFRVRSIREDNQAGPWSQPFTSPMNIEPFLDGESKRFQYEMVLKTDKPSVSPVVTSRQIDYSYNATVQLVDGEIPVPRF